MPSFCLKTRDLHQSSPTKDDHLSPLSSPLLSQAKDLYGPTGGWNASLVSSLGLVAAGLTAGDLDNLTWPEAVSPAAAAHLGGEKAADLRRETKDRLAPEALARMRVRAETEEAAEEARQILEPLLEHFRVGWPLLPGAVRHCSLLLLTRQTPTNVCQREFSDWLLQGDKIIEKKKTLEKPKF